MKKLATYLSTFTLLLMLGACDGGGATGPNTDPDPNPLGSVRDYEIVDINVTLPEGVNLNLSNTSLLSYLETFDVSEGGTTKGIHKEDSRNLAILMDQEDNPLLMGFITKNDREISVKTTVEAVLYFSLGTLFTPFGIQERYLEESSQLPGFDAFVEEAETMFKSNIKFLSSNEFKTHVNEKTRQIINSADSLDVRNLIASTIHLDSKDIRSGIQISEKEGLSISIVNNYRRRAHGFLYKTEIVKEDGTKDGNKVELIEDIVEKNASSEKDVAVNTTKEFIQATGTIADIASGTGVGFFRTETDPLPLQLNDDEKEATYKVRVIGPSLEVKLPKMTSAELDKMGELIDETLAFDIMLPVLLTVVNTGGLLDGIDEKRFTGYSNALKSFTASIPSVNDAIKEGDLATASTELIKALYNNVAGESVGDVMKGLVNGLTEYYKARGSEFYLQKADEIEGKLDKTNKLLLLVDGLLLTNDVIYRQYTAFGTSSALEEWEVVARQNEVELTPQENVAFLNITADFEVLTPNVELSDGQAFEYHWETTGNFGVLQADVGNKEGTSFVSSQAKVQYKSNASDDELDENSIDKVMVEVFIKDGQNRSRVNDDTALVRIKPFKFEITPDGVTVEGETDVTMHLVRPDGSNVIANDPHLDYKVIWNTTAKHGKFTGGQSNITTYNQNKITYRALDRFTPEGTEEVTARIYSSEKGKKDYRFIDELSATINIENDPDKEILYKSIYLDSGVADPDQCADRGGYKYAVSIVSFKMPDPEKVDSYEATVFVTGGRDITVASWKHGQDIPQHHTWGYHNEIHGMRPDGGYNILLSFALSCSADAIADAKENLSAIKGYGEITVTLKPDED